MCLRGMQNVIIQLWNLIISFNFIQHFEVHVRTVYYYRWVHGRWNDTTFKSARECMVLTFITFIAPIKCPLQNELLSKNNLFYPVKCISIEIIEIGMWLSVYVFQCCQLFHLHNTQLGQFNLPSGKSYLILAFNTSLGFKLVHSLSK